MDQIKKAIEEMREQAIAKMPLDPKQSAAQLLDGIAILTELTRGAPHRVFAQMAEGLVAEHLAQYKAAVQNDLLASQQATNNALADALNMSREKREEKK